MSTHPVWLEVENPRSQARIHVVTRLVLLAALAALGCSSIYWFLYLALPALLFSLPALILLALLSVAAAVVWVTGAVFVLIGRRLPEIFADFLALTLTVQFQLAAHHLSPVDAYPSLRAGRLRDQTASPT